MMKNIKFKKKITFQIKSVKRDEDNFTKLYNEIQSNEDDRYSHGLSVE